MRMLLYYYANGCPNCRKAKKILEKIVPEDRIAMLEVRQARRDGDVLALSLNAMPQLFIGYYLEEEERIHVFTDEMGQPVRQVGVLNPGFTDFIGTQLYNIDNLFHKVQQGKITPNLLLKALKENDELDEQERKLSEQQGTNQG